MTTEFPEGSEPATSVRDAFLPLLLGLLAVLIWTAFQTAVLLAERRSAAEARASQQVALEQAKRIRDAADSLAAKTQSLADSGDAAAQLMISNLRQRGITFNKYAPTASAPP